MPQFDFYSFFYQTFWLLILFLSFYLFVLYNYLANTASALKFRKKLIDKNLDFISLNQDSTVEIYNKIVKILLKGLK